jgi:amino acid transporter
MIGTCPVLYIAWKLLNRTRFQHADEIDLQKNMDEIAEYEKTLRLQGES